MRRSAGLQVLAFLAVHPDGATTTDLIRAIWPGLPPGSISNRLHTTLSDLRKQLHPLIGDDPITRQGDRYHLNHAAVDTDLQQLRAATGALPHAATAGLRQLACRAVVDAYRGELAAGHFWPWLQPLREALRRDVLDAYLYLAAMAPHQQAVELLHDAVAVDPYNEYLNRRAAAAVDAVSGRAAATARKREPDA